MTSVAARLCAGGTTEALLRSRKGPLAWSGAKGLEPLTRISTQLVRGNVRLVGWWPAWVGGAQ